MVHIDWLIAFQCMYLVRVPSVYEYGVQWGVQWDRIRMPYVLTLGVPKTGLKLARVLNTDPSSTVYQIPDNPLEGPLWRVGTLTNTIHWAESSKLFKYRQNRGKYSVKCSMIGYRSYALSYLSWGTPLYRSSLASEITFQSGNPPSENQYFSTFQIPLERRWGEFPLLKMKQKRGSGCNRGTPQEKQLIA